MKVYLCTISWNYEGDNHIAIVSTMELAKELERKWCEGDRRGDSFDTDIMEIDKIYEELLYD